ncbi:MAG: orotidine-5'-phosphate decarboxylase [Armatimonadetes bacterium]|nr:orotidine-5'-phosphate decarboxylase [Armatimonadota bacterium]
MHPTSQILLPLDTDTADKALALASQLQGEVAGFKVGLELINAAGFGLLHQLQVVAGPDVKIFYDCKFHDIPNTVAGAARAAARRGVWMFNVHASGGGAMMRAAVEAAAEGARSGGLARPLVIAVTVLTSIDAATLGGELGVSESVTDHVIRLARLAQDSGCDGVVASPHEIAALRAACGPDFTLVIPGVRPAGADPGDQRRVMTPGEAVRAGADYLVVGRPITAAPDPVAAARRVNAEADAARNNG